MPSATSLSNMLILTAMLSLLASILTLVNADELEIEYCYCSAPCLPCSGEPQRGWVKYFNYTSEREGGANYLWNAKCGFKTDNKEWYAD